jgi:hypothetical protein
VSFFDLVIAHLKEPEYLHVLLNPLPVYGIALGDLALFIGILSRSRAAQVAALVIVFLSAFSAWPVKHYGEEAWDAIDAKSDETGGVWLDAHAQRAERFIFVFYIAAAVAAAALLVPWRFPKSGLPLSCLTLVVSLVALGFGCWIAYAGGQVRHTEFRFGKPSEKRGDYERLYQP